MATFIYQDGRFVPDEGFDRGPMLVYPEEEWRRRVDLYIRRGGIIWMLKGYLLFMTIPLVFIIFYLTNPEADTPVPMNWIALLFTLLVTVMTIGSIYYGLWAIARNPLNGLYEKGFQHNYRSFYPYEEIERIERRREGRRGEEVPVLHIRKEPSPDVDHLADIRVSFIYKFLGDEGVKELDRSQARRSRLSLMVGGGGQLLPS